MDQFESLSKEEKQAKKNNLIFFDCTQNIIKFDIINHILHHNSSISCIYQNTVYINQSAQHHHEIQNERGWLLYGEK